MFVIKKIQCGFKLTFTLCQRERNVGPFDFHDMMRYVQFLTSLYMKLTLKVLCFSFPVCRHVVHATASPQWLAGRPGHSVWGGPSHCDPLWPRLGSDMHENGWSSVQHCWKGAICSLFNSISTAKFLSNVNIWSMLHRSKTSLSFTWWTSQKCQTSTRCMSCTTPAPSCSFSGRTNPHAVAGVPFRCQNLMFSMPLFSGTNTSWLIWAPVTTIRSTGQWRTSRRW